MNGAAQSNESRSGHGVSSSRHGRMTPSSRPRRRPTSPASMKPVADHWPARSWSPPWCSSPGARRSTAWPIPSSCCADRREVLYARIVERALAWHIVFIEVEEIDRINIYHATHAGHAARARRRAAHRARHALARIDGNCAAARPALPGRGDHRRRCQRPFDHGRLDPRQGLARPAHARTAQAVAAVRFRRTQGLLDARAPGGVARPGPARNTGAASRRCARATICSHRRSANHSRHNAAVALHSSGAIEGRRDLRVATSAMQERMLRDIEGVIGLSAGRFPTAPRGRQPRGSHALT